MVCKMLDICFIKLIKLYFFFPGTFIDDKHEEYLLRHKNVLKEGIQVVWKAYNFFLFFTSNTLTVQQFLKFRKHEMIRFYPVSHFEDRQTNQKKSWEHINVDIIKCGRKHYT